MNELRSTWLRYGLAIAVFALTLGVSLTLSYFDYKINLTLLIVLGIGAVAWYAGRGPGIFLAILLLVSTIVRNPPAENASAARLIFGYFSAFMLLVFIAWLISGRRQVSVQNGMLRRQNELLLRCVGDGIIGFDRGGGCIFVNPAAAEMLGRDADAMAGAPYTTLRAPARDPEPGGGGSAIHQTFENGTPVHSDNESFLKSDGTSFPVEYTSTPIREDGRLLGAVVVFRDVSEKRRAETELRQKAMLIEQSDEAIFIWDPERGIIDWNAGSERLYGYTKQEAIGQMGYLMLRTVFPIPQEEFLAELEKHGWWAGEVRQITKAGAEVFSASRYQVMEAPGGRIVLQTNRDITERKRAAVELAASEARYRELFKHNPLPMWVYDLETLQFLAVNKAATLHYGYSREEFLSMTIRDVRPPEDVPALLEDVSRTHETLSGGNCWKHRKKDGSTILVEITSHELNFDGRPARLVLLNDITKRTLAEKAVRDLNESLEKRVAERTAQLVTANKELEAFSYSVSHDLRAPLRAIDGFSRMVMEDHADKLDDEGMRQLGVIRSNAQNMGRLIDDLLAFSRLGRKQMEPVTIDMTELANAVGSELTGGEREGAASIRVDPLPSATGDPALLRQVFVNLLSNAVKYSGTKGNTAIQVGSRVENGENVYFVKDHGVGFDMKYANKLFGVFQRLHSAEEFEGTGVGLAIVQRIVHRHGGRVWAEGAIDEGATFYFALPNDGTARRRQID